MKKFDKNAKTVLVSIEMEFEGTVRNHAILIENQFIPTTNDGVEDFEIQLDGDPIEIVARFRGVSGSKLKKFAVTMDEKIIYKIENIMFKYEQIEIKTHVPYSKLNSNLTA